MPAGRSHEWGAFMEAKRKELTRLNGAYKNTLNNAKVGGGLCFYASCRSPHDVRAVLHSDMHTCMGRGACMPAGDAHRGPRQGRWAAPRGGARGSTCVRVAYPGTARGLSWHSAWSGMQPASLD